jgi:hypothetical protein
MMCDLICISGHAERGSSHESAAPQALVIANKVN